MAQLTRPDRTTKTYWRTSVDEHVFSDPGIEVFLPQSATLSNVPPALLEYESLPGLWPTEEITVRNMHEYFSGQNSITIPMDGYEDTLYIPRYDSSKVDESISEAVSQGLLWMINGPASILGEPVPPGVS